MKIKLFCNKIKKFKKKNFCELLLFTFSKKNFKIKISFKQENFILFSVALALINILTLLTLQICLI